MNTVVPSCAPASFPIPEFGRSADGLTVAIKASAKGDVDGGGMLGLKGGLVKIN